ncbi:hypothetical protein [Streptomyces sp. NPDC026673]|uniref:hypothetical protein n=1 Tax=Streptomyces sp. NPDC026673 TaxID=3155724 RepID=UPI0033C6AC6F
MSLLMPPPRSPVPLGAPSAGPSREVYVPPSEPGDDRLRDDGLAELLSSAEAVVICLVVALLVVFLVTDRRPPRRRPRHRR